MPRLQVDIQEAFIDELVVVFINDAEICRRTVRTRFQTGLADSLQCDVPEGPVRYRIELPNKHLSLSGEFAASSDRSLGVSLSPEGQLSAQISQEPFRYA